MLKLTLVVLYLGQGLCSEVPSDGKDCGLPCRSVRMVDVFLAKIPEESIEVSEGVKFVKTNTVGDGRSARNSMLSRFKRFLTNYELQVKLHDILPRKQDVSAALHTAVGYLNDLQSGKKLLLGSTVL